MYPNGHGERQPAAALAVLHVISGDLWAGAEVATYHLLCALAENGSVDVAAAVLNEGELSRRLSAAGVRCHVLPERELGFFALARRIRSLAAQADVVHAHRYKENLLAAASGKPWIATQHGMPEGGTWCARVRLARGELLDYVAKRVSAARVVAVSHAMAERLGRRFGEKVSCVWNGIGDPQRQVTPDAWNERPLRCGVLARLVSVKAIELAIDAVAGCPDVELEIVGDGPERSALERHARAAGVEGRVRFLGFLPNPHGALARWRCLLVTSRHEGHPIGVLESIALGTPVLTGALPGVEEILAGRAGWSIPTRRAARWSEILGAVMSDVDQGLAVSRAARERFLEAFSADRCASEMTSLYRAVASEAHG
ncbi:MAG: glycosyltransferase [Myxococcales bacterium]|nr:glycosyltransferase [Myxococcales bacterium]